LRTFKNLLPLLRRQNPNIPSRWVEIVDSQIYKKEVEQAFYDKFGYVYWFFTVPRQWGLWYQGNWYDPEDPNHTVREARSNYLPPLNAVRPGEAPLPQPTRITADSQVTPTILDYYGGNIDDSYFRYRIGGYALISDILPEPDRQALRQHEYTSSSGVVNMLDASASGLAIGAEGAANAVVSVSENVAGFILPKLPWWLYAGAGAYLYLKFKK